MVQMSAIEGLKGKILAEIVKDKKWKKLSEEKRMRILEVIDEEFNKCGSPRSLLNPKWLKNLYKRIKEAKEQE